MADVALRVGLERIRRDRLRDKQTQQDGGPKGGDVGPILDGISVRADKAYITESLMDPNAKLAKGFENLTISPMPPLGVLLKEQELADILAFLYTLTTSPKGGITVPVKKPNQYE